MGTLRESSDPKGIFPSSWFGFSDLPTNAEILIDDITERITIKKRDSIGKFYDVEILTFDEYEELNAIGRRGARAGRNMK